MTKLVLKGNYLLILGVDEDNLDTSNPSDLKQKIDAAYQASIVMVNDCKHPITKKILLNEKQTADLLELMSRAYEQINTEVKLMSYISGRYVQDKENTKGITRFAHMNACTFSDAGTKLQIVYKIHEPAPAPQHTADTQETSSAPVATTEQPPVANTVAQPAASTPSVPVATTEQPPVANTVAQPVASTPSVPVATTVQPSVVNTVTQPEAPTIPASAVITVVTPAQDNLSTQPIKVEKTITKAQQDFNEALAELNKKATMFTQLANTTQKSKYKQASEAALQLYIDLETQGTKFFELEEIDYDTFRTSCEQSIKLHRNTLESHRDMVSLIAKILAVIIFPVYLIGASVNYKQTGRFVFFPTDTATKVYKIEDAINNLEP